MVVRVAKHHISLFSFVLIHIIYIYKFIVLIYGRAFFSKSLNVVLYDAAMQRECSFYEPSDHRRHDISNFKT